MAKVKRKVKQTVKQERTKALRAGKLAIKKWQLLDSNQRPRMSIVMYCLWTRLG